MTAGRPLSALATLRGSFLTFLGAAVLIGVLLWFINPEIGAFRPGWAAMVVACGVVALSFGFVG